MTEKLYDADAYIKEFTATVIGTGTDARGDYAILDRTAFFPEQGGQYADGGVIGVSRVIDVQIVGGEIRHFVNSPLTVGETYECKLDFDVRFRKMQNHSGEHIVSGIIHSLFGLDNVGFHLGTEDVTIDYNGFLIKDQIRHVEQLANEAVVKNVLITAEFPTAEKLERLEYRSKLELESDVRIVTVEEYDVCACCAPHVRRTGEIGIIKLLDSIHYKGGVRIHMLCGFDAIDDYNKKYDNVSEIGLLLSSKQHETAETVSRLWNDYTELKRDVLALKKELITLKVSTIPKTDGNLCLFDEGLSNAELREAVNMLMDKCGGMCGVFSKNIAGGYSYVVGSRSVDLINIAREMSDLLGGRGGGKSGMIQGSVSANEEIIRQYFGV